MYSVVFFMPRLFLAFEAQDSTKSCTWGWASTDGERRNVATQQATHALAALLRQEFEDHERLLVVAAANHVQHAADLTDG